MLLLKLLASITYSKPTARADNSSKQLEPAARADSSSQLQSIQNFNIFISEPRTTLGKMSLKVLTLNVFGQFKHKFFNKTEARIPNTGNMWEEERMYGIVENIIKPQKYDVILIQELWVPRDHDILSEGDVEFPPEVLLQ